MAKPDPSESLREYDRKRDFGVTPEPGPDAVASPSARPRFMVHKHHARRLHYDLRLEIDGALASWAVPRGPCYDPAIKRLAVQTEDHPLAYGDFEGRIPDGQYGAGESLIWDRGHYDTIPPGQVAAQRRKGHIQFVIEGEKLRGQWHLLRTTAASGRRAAQGDNGASGPKSQWLLIKVDDEEADPKLDIVAERPESVLTGQVETRGPAPGGKGGGMHGDGAPKPDMPRLLATGVLGEAGRARAGSTRLATPLFTAIDLKSLPVDVARPQAILELPASLFGEEPAAASRESELCFRLSRGAGSGAQTPGAKRSGSRRPATKKREPAGELAELALVMRDLFAALALPAFACAAGDGALLVRVPIAPGSAPAQLERFAEKIARTLEAQVEALREKRVQLDLSLQGRAPALLEPLPEEAKSICALLAWDELDPSGPLPARDARWLRAHRDDAEARLRAMREQAKPLPRAR